jgi:hypothetical protein
VIVARREKASVWRRSREDVSGALRATLPAGLKGNESIILWKKKKKKKKKNRISNPRKGEVAFCSRYHV